MLTTADFITCARRSSGFRLAWSAVVFGTTLLPIATAVADVPGPLVELPPLSFDAAEPLPQPESIVPAPQMSVADFERMALENNPTLAVAWARVNAARGRQLQSGLYPNPIIGYTGQDMGEDGTAGQQGGYVSQQFITGMKLQLNRAIGSREVQEQRFLLDAQELRVLSDVRLRYYDALTAQRRVALTEELFSVSGQVADTSRRLLEAQHVAETDLLQAEIEAEEANILAGNARNQRDEAWRRLASVVGVTSLVPTPLSGNLDDDLPDYDWETAYATVLAQHPELSAAWARVERARLAIARARRENVPDVNVTAMVTHLNQTDDEVVGIQAGIPIPVLNQNQGRIMEASSDLIAARNSVERIQLDLQERLAIAFRRYANARQQAARYRDEIVPRAQRSLDLLGAGYREQQIDFIPLLTAQRTYIRVNLSYLDALAELRQATVVIEGQVLTDSLQRE